MTIALAVYLAGVLAAFLLLRRFDARISSPGDLAPPGILFAVALFWPLLLVLAVIS